MAESNSTASASPLLSIAQSAITKSILELEDTLGIALFERSPREELPTVDIGLIWRRGNFLAPALAEFIELSRAQQRSAKPF